LLVYFILIVVDLHLLLCNQSHLSYTRVSKLIQLQGHAIYNYDYKDYKEGGSTCVLNLTVYMCCSPHVGAVPDHPFTVHSKVEFLVMS